LERLNQENQIANSLKWGNYRGFLAVPILAFWFVIVFLKLEFDPHHYQTVDGANYEELAADLQKGRPFVLDGNVNRLGRSFSPYPPGYPCLLAIGNTLSHWIPVKLPGFFVVHGLLLLLAGFLWCRYLPVWPFCFFLFNDTLLELSCYSWSELSFILSLIFSGLILTKLQFKPSWLFLLVLVFSLSLSVFIRYSGVFMAFYLVWLMVSNVRTKPAFAQFLFAAGLFFALFLGGLALWEWLVYGQLTGGDRYPNTDTWPALAQALGVEGLNQLVLFKDFTGSSLASFQMGLVALVFIFVFLFWKVKRFSKEVIAKPSATAPVFARYLMGIGLFYFLFMVPLRWYFYFAESFDFRLLGPGFSIFILGFFLWLSAHFKCRSFWPVVLFLFSSMFFSVPKKEIYYKYQEWMWAPPKPRF